MSDLFLKKQIFFSNNPFLNAVDDVAHIVVRDIRSTRQAHPHLEEAFRHAVDVGGSVLLDGL